MVSAIILTGWPEEEDYIEACLKSVSWSDEILVVYGPETTKKCLTIIKKYTRKIFPDPGRDFALRHNFAKDKASGDWLLYVDADERVSKDLKLEIQTELVNPKFAAYELQRVNFFLGKQVRFGDRFPDYVVRLFKKESLRSWVGEIHESSQVDGAIGRLKSPLYHLTHRDIFSMVEKTIIFSEHEANLRFKTGHPPVVWWRLIRVFLTEFYNRIIRYQGFRQGTEGWIDGIFQSFSLFITYVRLWEMQRKTPLEQTYKDIDRKILEGEL